MIDAVRLLLVFLDFGARVVVLDALLLLLVFLEFASRVIVLDALQLLPAILDFGSRVVDCGPPLDAVRLPLAIPSVAVAVSVRGQICAVLQLASSIACASPPSYVSIL